MIRKNKEIRQTAIIVSEHLRNGRGHDQSAIKQKSPNEKFFHSTEKQPAGPENGPVFRCKNSRMGQTWVKSDFGTIRGQKEIPKNGGV
ncbi:MAG: hypothetical protein IKH12_05270 [Clostridia bacterium]|nr:hypothetical protein [Clostridia bacterium]